MPKTSARKGAALARLAVLVAALLAALCGAPEGARAQAGGEIPVKEAFDAAKELGTIEAWNAFLANYPKGFHADLARAYLKKLGAAPPAALPPAVSPTDEAASPPADPGRPAGEPPAEPPAGATAVAPEPPPAPDAAGAPPAPPALPPATPSGATAPTPADSAGASATDFAADLSATDPAKPAVARGGRYMGFPERFNRFYTDRAWTPSKTVYVSPNGKGDGATRQTPRAVQAAIAEARPGTRIQFLRGRYDGCYELGKETGGTYDDPVVLQAERNPDGASGVQVNCCGTGRQACFNLEAADYVAIDGFTLVGGRYGVRAVGAGYPASAHAKGLAVLDCQGRDQENDAFFTGQSDWAVLERNVGSGARKGDGHGFYLSNGGDWNVVRFNETFGNVSSDFQINPDPQSTCLDVGVPAADPRCHAYAGEGEGGQGASDYFLVDSNYFHHGKDIGANFASTRRSVVRNNIFGPHAERHNTSFYKEVEAPELGASDNRILHNLFVTTGRHAVQFVSDSTRNLFANNVMLGLRIAGGRAAANPDAVLMGVDDSVGANVYRGNLYVAGRIEGRQPGGDETARPDFSASWFKKFPTGLNHDPNDLAPATGSPLVGAAPRSADAPADRNGTERADPATLGPIEAGAAPAEEPAEEQAKKPAGETAAQDAPASTPAPKPPEPEPEPPAPPPPPAAAPAAPAPKAPMPAPAPPAPAPAREGAAVPRAVTVARATAIPACTLFVDAAAARGGDGSAAKPHGTIAAAVAAAQSGAVICVAEGTYPEALAPGEKAFTLAGGFQSGKGFAVRDSAAYVSRARGSGGSFLRIVDPGPKGEALTAIDGFDISGYGQAILRDHYEPQRFDLTNNAIHDNVCPDQKRVGAGFMLANVSGTIRGNVFRRNACGRGGAGALVDGLNGSAVTIAENLVEGSMGTEPDSAHGGGLYLFGNKLTITGNAFVGNSVTQWGGGLYVGAFTAGKQFTNATLSWNVYRGNRAGNSGGGFFCDEGATCLASHEIYAGNCGGNVLLDGGADGSGPTTARFDHVTVVGALEPDCKTPGIGVLVTKDSKAADSYAFTNALFSGNAAGKDFAAYCDKFCQNVTVRVTHAMVQTEHARQKMSVSFGEGIVPPADPLFADPARSDYHLRSAAGRWTPSGRARDEASSPALGKAFPKGELGAYGDSPEASEPR